MTWTGILYGNSRHVTGLAPAPLGGLANFARGVKGYFQTVGVTPRIGPTGTRGDPLIVTQATPTAITFASSNGLAGPNARPSFEADITFVGTGLAAATTTLANGQAFKVLTAGTVTGIAHRFTHRLAEAVDAGITDETRLQALRQPAFLALDAELTLPDLPAAAISAAMVQTFDGNGFAPLKAFFEQNDLALRRRHASPRPRARSRSSDPAAPTTSSPISEACRRPSGSPRRAATSTGSRTSSSWACRTASSRSAPSGPRRAASWWAETAPSASSGAPAAACSSTGAAMTRGPVPRATT